MRFKASLSQRGIRILTKGELARSEAMLSPCCAHLGCSVLCLLLCMSPSTCQTSLQASKPSCFALAAFLPALEKCGKTCDVLLAPDTVDFVQTSLNTDDLAATAHFEVASAAWAYYNDL